MTTPQEDQPISKNQALELLDMRLQQINHAMKAEPDHHSERYGKLCQAKMNAKNDKHTITKYPKPKNLNRIWNTWA